MEKDKDEIKSHIFIEHKTYKPCTKYGAGNCDSSMCRFYHIKLHSKNDICFKCGKIFESKTELINHIKTVHGNTICHKFLENKCERNSEDCIFSHKINATQMISPNIQQDFRQSPPLPLHSPAIGMLNMSTHIQNQQRRNSQGKTPTLETMMELIPQIVSQVVQAITIQLGN